MKINKFLLTLIILFIPLSFFIGHFMASLKYSIPLAHCSVATIPFDQMESIRILPPMNALFRNYYGHTYNFTDHIVPTGISLTEYYKTFNNGGFHYLKTINGEIVACGFYK